MTTPWKPVLTTEPTEAGKAIKIGQTDVNGQMVDAPMVLNESGEEVPFDIAFQQGKLKRANNEAEDRRRANDQAAEMLSKFFGVEYPSDRETRMAQLNEHLAKLPAALKELGDLRQMRDNGKLNDADPEEFNRQVQSAANELVQAAEQRAADAKTAQMAAETKRDSLAEELKGDRLDRALTDFYHSHGGFRDKTLGMFLAQAKANLSGHSWEPTGEFDANRVPILELRDKNGSARLDGAQQGKMTLQKWGETTEFMDLVGPLLKEPAGSNDQVLDLPGGQSGATATPDQLMDVANQEYLDNRS